MDPGNPRQGPIANARVINVSSLAGLAGYPAGTAYSSSKWAVEGLSESLHYELMPFGIQVCVVEPGGYKTEIYQSNAQHSRAPVDSVYAPLQAALDKSLTSSIVPRGTPSTAWWSSICLLWRLISSGRHAAAAASRVQRNSVPSTQMRCMITASRRASATMALFMPRCLAIFIAQALSQDHFFERSMLWAAS